MINKKTERICVHSTLEKANITKLATIITARIRVSKVSILVIVQHKKKISFVRPQSLCTKQSFSLYVIILLIVLSCLVRSE